MPKGTQHFMSLPAVFSDCRPRADVAVGENADPASGLTLEPGLLGRLLVG